MQRVLSVFMAFCVALTLSMDVHAKRFGGGKSIGSAPSHQTRQVQQQRTDQTAAVQQQAGRTAAASGASRWLGPLAGIAAGGLLAAMLFGDGFEGFQFLDFLLLGLAAFFIFRFIARRRQQQQPAMAGHAPLQREIQPQQPSIFGGSSAPLASAAPVINAPSWFNEQRFVEQAREHFLSLQAHWDANEMDKIAEFVTPQLLSFLKQERDEIGDAYQSTYIDNLQVTLEGVDDNAEKTVATLTFSGVAKTSRFDQGEPFSESWRMERTQGENQPWLVAGIRQNG